MSQTAKALEVRCKCEDAYVQQVTYAGYVFRVYYPDQPPLELDFDPLMSNVEDRNSVVMLHWQAMPKGSRRWGFLSVRKDVIEGQVRETAEYKIADTVYFEVGGRTLQLDENVHKTLPTSVLLFRDVVPVLEHDGMRTVYRLKAEG